MGIKAKRHKKIHLAALLRDQERCRLDGATAYSIAIRVHINVPEKLFFIRRYPNLIKEEVSAWGRINEA
jgi:hypothetical protein